MLDVQDWLFVVAKLQMEERDVSRVTLCILFGPGLRPRTFLERNKNASGGSRWGTKLDTLNRPVLKYRTKALFISNSSAKWK